MFTTSTGKLQPGWAFLFSAVLSGVAFVISGNIARQIVGDRAFLFELVFRPLLCLMLVGLFVWLLTVGDQMDDHRIAGQGLPRTKGWLKQFVLGTVVGCVLTLIAVVPIHYWGHFVFKHDRGWTIAPKIAAVIVVLLTGALAEELMFRGYPFQHLEKGIGAVPAIAVFSAIYGVVHLVNPSVSRWGVLNTILIGILLSIAYLRTRALWLPWGIHFGWNAMLGSVFGLPVSGFHFFNVVLRTTATGPAWLTGGAYGVEAGATGAAAILVGILIVWLLPVSKLSRPTAFRPVRPPARNDLSSIKP